MRGGCRRGSGGVLFGDADDQPRLCISDKACCTHVCCCGCWDPFSTGLEGHGHEEELGSLVAWNMARQKHTRRSQEPLARADPGSTFSFSFLECPGCQRMSAAWHVGGGSPTGPVSAPLDPPPCAPTNGRPGFSFGFLGAGGRLPKARRGRFFLSPPALKMRATRSERSGTGGRLSSKTGTRHQWWTISAAKIGALLVLLL